MSATSFRSPFARLARVRERNRVLRTPGTVA